MAGTIANREVSGTIGYVNDFAVYGNPGSLAITSVAAGSPISRTDATTTYGVSTNYTNKKITVAINAAMPANTSLTLSTTAPPGAVSAGTVTLSTTTQNLVTGISQTSGTYALTYTFSASITAGVIASGTRTVTFTLVDGP